MKKSRTKIVVTGAAGFIGSYLVGALNAIGEGQIILADDFSRPERERNYSGKSFLRLENREGLLSRLEAEGAEIKAFFHIGARTDTSELDVHLFRKLNSGYSEAVWKFCTRHEIPMIYASSAATYGDGGQGFNDEPSRISSLHPLNPYGQSKQDFDLWVLGQKEAPPFWAGLKFFNVFGPNEYHKGRMASVVFHAFNQIAQGGQVKLFRSHRPDFPDGGQMRDFIYVRDVAEVILWLFQNGTEARSGIYNLGTGTARSFLDLAHGVFAALNKTPHIEWVDTPLDIRDTYQYFTEAKMDRLANCGYRKPFTDLESGIHDYVVHYLTRGRIF